MKYMHNIYISVHYVKNNFLFDFDKRYFANTCAAFSNRTPLPQNAMNSYSFTIQAWRLRMVSEKSGLYVGCVGVSLYSGPTVAMYWA